MKQVIAVVHSAIARLAVAMSLLMVVFVPGNAHPRYQDSGASLQQRPPHDSIAADAVFSHGMSPADIIAAVAILVSVVAIYYAVKQNKDAKETLVKVGTNLVATEQAVAVIQGTAESLSSIANQIPTRYVGRFPDNVKEITALLASAQSEIVIVTDFAGYSSYSDPTAFRDYFNAVEFTVRKNSDFKVRLYLYDSEKHQQLLQSSLPRATYTEQSFVKPTDARLTAFMKRMERHGKTIRDYDGFISALMDDEARCIEQFEDLDQCECFEMHSAVPIFLWMVDQRECIFAFEDESEQKKNYFSFRTRDGRLLEYFTQYIADIASRVYGRPVRNVADISEMNLLVPELGTCTVINDKLDPCNYHRDRLDVEHYEQFGTDGEKDLSDSEIELTGTRSMTELFEKMEDKKTPAGHWGLMTTQRTWLRDHITRASKSKHSAGDGALQILQLGTAGPFHYFGTAKIVAEGLAAAEISSQVPAILYTRDRCLTPILAVKSLLSKIDDITTNPVQQSTFANEWALVEARGLRKALDSSFYNIGAEKSPMTSILKHDIELGELCDAHLTDAIPPVDVIIAHFTFTMWAGLTVAQCNQGYENVAALLKPRGILLAALSDFHNPVVSSVDEYHQNFAAAGLRLIRATRVWDVYDLSSTERRRLLYSKTPQVFRKRAILAEYEKA